MTRFRVAVGQCRGCGRRVQGRHPEQSSDALGTAAAQVGPRALAWATWLHYGLGLSFGKCSSVLGRLGVDVTAGAISASAASTSTDLVATHKAIKDHIAAAPAVTNSRRDGLAHRRRGSVAVGGGHRTGPRRLRRNDHPRRWEIYNSNDKARHQSCIAHLLRRSHEMIEDLPAWARATPRQVRDLLVEGLDARDLDTVARAKAVVDIGERVHLLFEQAHPHDANRRLIQHLRHERAALFSFLTIDGVDATNWRGEQAVRRAVVNRKVWRGNRTARGAMTQGRVMTCLRTAHQVGADAIAMMVDLARAPSPGLVAGFTLRSG